MPLKKERNNQVVAMREQGISYGKIGSHFGICRDRVRQIVVRHKQEQEISEKWPFCALLSHRALTVLGSKFGDTAFENPEIVVNYGKRNILKLRNCGNMTLREIDRALTRLDYIKDGQKW